jgi:hypothetical protein
MDIIIFATSLNKQSYLDVMEIEPSSQKAGSTIQGLCFLCVYSFELAFE